MHFNKLNHERNLSNEKTHIYAIIPATVRYSAKLSAAEKLLFAETTALSTKEGYCWANNTYFAKVFGVTNRSIIRWINNLK